MAELTISPVSKPAAESAADGQEDLRGFLRYSHIFASLVREVLEEKILRDVSSDPLSLSQFHLLKLIALNGKHQVGEVADFLGVSAPAASKNIDKLERLGMVARGPSPGDRRAILLSSSPKGRRLVDKYEAAKQERLAPVLAGFSSQEVRQLSRLMERFSLRMLRMEEPGDGLCFRCSAYYEDQCPVSHLHDQCPYQRLRKREPRARHQSAAQEDHA